MDAAWYAVSGAVLASVLVVPALVVYLLTVASGGWLPLVGVLAMAPGVLMGGAALWVMTR